MADISVTDCIARIRHLPEAVADRTVEVMRDEINSSTHGTGELARTVRKGKYADGSYYVETAKYVGGGIYGIREVGAIIRAGRKALWPRYRDALRWEDESGVHFARPPKDGTSPAVGPAQPNDFVTRTKDKVEGEINSIWNSL